MKKRQRERKIGKNGYLLGIYKRYRLIGASSEKDFSDCFTGWKLSLSTSGGICFFSISVMCFRLIGSSNSVPVLEAWLCSAFQFTPVAFFSSERKKHGDNFVFLFLWFMSNTSPCNFSCRAERNKLYWQIAHLRSQGQNKIKNKKVKHYFFVFLSFIVFTFILKMFFLHSLVQLIWFLKNKYVCIAIRGLKSGYPA